MEWSDKGVTSDSNSVINMHFKIPGSEIVGALPFYVLPWETEYLIIGWDAMHRRHLLGKIEDLLIIQEAQGLTTGVSSSDGNRQLTDMNGKAITTDELLFADEPETPLSELTPDEKEEINKSLEEYKELFAPKPAGSALVEPMAVVFKSSVVIFRVWRRQ